MCWVLRDVLFKDVLFNLGSVFQKSVPGGGNSKFKGPKHEHAWHVGGIITGRPLYFEVTKVSGEAVGYEIC